MQPRDPDVVIVGAGIAGASEAGRARRGRFYNRMAKGDRQAQMALGALFVGPHRLPAEAFGEELHAALLA